MTSLKNNVTGKESWCLAYYPMMKQQSSAWVGENTPRLQKVRFHKSQVKTMSVIFCCWQGVKRKEFVPEGQTVNFEFCIETMDRLLKRLGALGWTRLNKVTGCYCTIMLLPTTQLPSSSFLLRKALLFFTTPLTRFGTCVQLSVP